MSSEVRSYRVGSSWWGSGEGWLDVAMTRKVVRSKRMTSVALHASAKVVRCFERTDALGMRVWTMLDQAWGESVVRRKNSG